MRPEELGYYLHPSKQLGDPGHPELDINIVAEPEQVADPVTHLVTQDLVG